MVRQSDDACEEGPHNIQQLRQEYGEKELLNKQEELNAELLRHGESIRYYTVSALPEAENLIKAASLQLKASDTDITQFIQSVNSALSIKKGYLETVYLYNIAVLESELYK